MRLELLRALRHRPADPGADARCCRSASSSTSISTCGRPLAMSRPSRAGSPEADRPFHVEIDTGMSRAGVRWDDRASLEPLATLLQTANGWEGAFTHFLAAESDADATRRQWDRFQEVLRALPRRPAADSCGQQRRGAPGKVFAGDLVRPGIYLYGGAAGSPSPQPVAALRARVVAVRSIAAGDTRRIRSDLASRAADGGRHGRGGIRGRISPGEPAAGPERLHVKSS